MAQARDLIQLSTRQWAGVIRAAAEVATGNNETFHQNQGFLKWVSSKTSFLEC